MSGCGNSERKKKFMEKYDEKTNSVLGTCWDNHDYYFRGVVFYLAKQTTSVNDRVVKIWNSVGRLLGRDVYKRQAYTGGGNMVETLKDLVRKLTSSSSTSKHDKVVIAEAANSGNKMNT